MRKLVFVFLFFTCALAAFAADISVSASVNSNVIALDERLELSLDISGGGTNIPDMQLPPLANFTSHSAGRSRNISIVNGRMSSSVNFRYILAPQAPGKFTIPPIVFEHEGNRYKTQPIDVEVLARGSAPQSRAPEQAAHGDKDLFITATVDKSTAYVNEQVTYTLRFYQAVRLLSNPQYSPPSFAGAWTEELPSGNYSTTVNGRQYMVSEVKTLLFPMRAGKLSIGSASLKCRAQGGGASDPFSDDFFNNFFSGGGKPVVLQSQPLSVNVLELPASGNNSADTGAVGSYAIEASLDRNAARVNDAVTLTLKISGTGNIKTLPAPVLPDWPDFRKYETVSSVNTEKSGGTLKGSATFKTVLVPQTPGRKTIPPVVYSFFDPSSKKYRTVTTAPLALGVSPGEATGAPGMAGKPTEGAANGVTVVNRDIRYLKSITHWEKAGGYIYKKPWFIALNGLPVLLLLAAFAYTRRRSKLSGDVAFARRAIASKTARKYLKQAKTLLGPASPLEFYGALSRALVEYIAHKTNVSADGLTLAAIDALLSGRGITQEDRQQIKQLLDECDFVRFSPSKVTPGMTEKAYAQGESIINRLERVLK